MRKSIVHLFILVFYIQACTKEESPLNPTEVLTTSKWQLFSLLVENPAGTTPADITIGSFKSCERDDLMEFKTGGQYSCSENYEVCVTNASVFYAMNGGNWVIIGDTSLSISAGLIGQTYRFGKITKTSVELKQTVQNYFGETMIFRFNLKAVQ